MENNSNLADSLSHRLWCVCFFQCENNVELYVAGNIADYGLFQKLGFIVQYAVAVLLVGQYMYKDDKNYWTQHLQSMQGI